MGKQLLCAAGLLALAACAQDKSALTSRDTILATGSSTVYPFTKAVAEQFHQKNPKLRMPTIKNTGTGPGITEFCAGAGAEFPDIVDASRRMRPDELAQCNANGVGAVTELQIGTDGLVFVQSPAGPKLSLTKKQVYEALAATPYGRPQTRIKWKDVDPSLPDMPILVYGPAPKDGTRDSLNELILNPGCETDAKMAALKTSDEAQYKRVCSTIRADQAYQTNGEDDEKTTMFLIVNPGAIGIFGYSYLEENAGRLRGIPVGGVEPNAESIAAGTYAGARPLFIYVKVDQANRVPGLKAFLAEYASAIAPGGYLAKHGLVPASDKIRTQTVQLASNLQAVSKEALAQPMQPM